MAKTYTAKTPPDDFKVTTPENSLLSQQAVTNKGTSLVILRPQLPRIHYYDNKQLQIKESHTLYQPTVEPLPQYPIGLVL